MRAKRDWQFFASAVVLVALVSTGAGLILLPPDGDDSREIPNHYLQADATSVETGEVVSVMQIWHLNGRWQWQWHDTDVASPSPSSLVFDDGTYHSYDAHNHTYYSEELPEGEPGASFGPVGFIGFVPALDPATFLGRLALSDSYLDASILGSEVLRDRAVQVIEVRYRTTGGPEPFDFQTTYWLDPEAMLVVATEIGLPGQVTRYEIVELRLDVPIQPEQVNFVVPLGAREIDPPPYSVANLARLRSNDPDVPPGFLTPGYIPAEYELASRRTENLSNEDPATLWLEFDAGRLANGAVQALLIEQDEAIQELPAWTRSAPEVSIDGHRAFYRQGDYSLEIIWIQDGLQVLVRANDLPMEELLAVAESLR